MANGHSAKRVGAGYPDVLCIRSSYALWRPKSRERGGAEIVGNSRRALARRRRRLACRRGCQTPRPAQARKHRLQSIGRGGESEHAQSIGFGGRPGAPEDGETPAGPLLRAFGSEPEVRRRAAINEVLQLSGGYTKRRAAQREPPRQLQTPALVQRCFYALASSDTKDGIGA